MMGQSQNLADFLIMLLSADWFLPYWSEIGIHIDESRKIPIRDGSRKVIDTALSGAEKFSRSRVFSDPAFRTAPLFLAVVRDCRSESEILPVYEEWSIISHAKLQPTFIYWDHTLILVHGDLQHNQPNVDTAIRAGVERAWERCHTEGPDFLELCEKSKSAWDTHLGSLLNSPRTLPSYLNLVLADRNFNLLWRHLRQELMPQELNELALWYRSMLKNRFKSDRLDLIPSCIE